MEDAFREDSSADRASLTAHWHIGEFLVTSQTAWSQSDSDARAGADFLPGDYFYQVTELAADALSQELRLTSPADKRFRYVAGAYFGTNDFEQDNMFFANYPGALPLAGDTITHFDQSTDAWSLFGQVDFDLTEHLTMSGGLRYTDEQKDVDLARTVLTPGVLSLFVFPPYAPFGMSRAESVTDGLVNLSYKPNDDLMFYASWAQGTKSGGFADSATLLEQSEYESEVAQTAEVGGAIQSSGGQLTANATLYSTDVDDYQLVTFTGTQFVVDNTDLEATGIESEILLAPTLRARARHQLAQHLFARRGREHWGKNPARATLVGWRRPCLRARSRERLAAHPRWIGRLRIQPDAPARPGCGAGGGQHHHVRRRHRCEIGQGSRHPSYRTQSHRRESLHVRVPDAISASRQRKRTIRTAAHRRAAGVV